MFSFIVTFPLTSHLLSEIVKLIVSVRIVTVLAFLVVVVDLFADEHVAFVR